MNFQSICHTWLCCHKCVYEFPVARKSTPCLGPKSKMKLITLKFMFNRGILWMFPFPFPPACAYPAKLRIATKKWEFVLMRANIPHTTLMSVLLYTPKQVFEVDSWQNAAVTHSSLSFSYLQFWESSMMILRLKAKPWPYFWYALYFWLSPFKPKEQRTRQFVYKNK